LKRTNIASLLTTERVKNQPISINQPDGRKAGDIASTFNVVNEFIRSGLKLFDEAGKFTAMIWIGLCGK
jgi:hypothetical protein